MPFVTTEPAITSASLMPATKVVSPGTGLKFVTLPLLVAYFGPAIFSSSSARTQ